MCEKKINILRVGTYPTHQRRGMGYHSYKIGNKEGFRTIFLTPKDSGRRLESFSGVDLIERDFLMVPRPRNGNIFTSVLFLFRRLSSIFMFSIYGIYLMLFENCRIVHIHSPMFIPIALFARLLGRRAYITFHGTDFYRIKDSIMYAFVGRLLSGAFAISPAMVPRLSQVHGFSKVKQVFNGVDKDIFVNRHQKRSKAILAVGTLKEEKGFDVLIQAFYLFQRASAGNQSYHLHIAGDGPLKRDLLKLVEKFGLNDKVHILGHREVNDLVSLYNDCEIFVLSSISEGFPKVLLEATASGCKIVSTDVGSVTEIYPDYSFVCESGSSERLAECLSCCVGTSHESMKGFYQGVLDRFTWEAVSDSYFDVYEVGEMQA